MDERITIGVLCPIPGGNYFGGLLGGINRAVSSAGGRVVAIQTIDPALTGSFEASIQAPQFDVPVAWSRLDGVISLAESVSQGYLQRINEQGTPIVMVSREFDGLTCPSVMPDNTGGIHAAVDHLVEHGYRRIAFAGNLSQSDIRERHDGYREGLRRHGIEPDESLFIPTSDNLHDGGYRAGQALLRAGLRPDALIAATDSNAIGIMNAVEEAGWSLPDDLPIVGFDNIDEAVYTVPALTTLSVPLDRLGELAADLLLRQIAGRPETPGRHQITASMVVRQSCGCGASRAGDAAGTPAHLATRLRVVLVPEAKPLPGVLRRFNATLDAVVSLFATLEGTNDRPALDALAGELHDLGLRHETLNRILHVIRGYVDELAVSSSPRYRQMLDRRLMDLAMALGDLMSRDDARFRADVKRRMQAHYEVGVALLRSDQDPATLSWFGHTRALFGCLGLWSADDGRPQARELVITGVYGGAATLAALVGDRMPAESFPPEILIDQVNAAYGQVLHVILVKSGPTQWGILAAPTSIRQLAVEGREPFNDWAAFLGIALEQKQAQDELNAVANASRPRT